MPTIHCPNCNESHKIKKGLIGHEMECKKCKTHFTILICPECNGLLEGDELFCSNCGKKLPPIRITSPKNIKTDDFDIIYCNSCGSLIKKNTNYCSHCGKKWFDTETQTKTGILSVIFIFLVLANLLFAAIYGDGLKEHFVLLVASIFGGIRIIKSISNKDLKNNFKKCILALVLYYCGILLLIMFLIFADNDDRVRAARNFGKGG